MQKKIAAWHGDIPWMHGSEGGGGVRPITCRCWKLLVLWNGIKGWFARWRGGARYEVVLRGEDGCVLLVVSCPDPPLHVWGSGVLSDFSCYSSPIWELESDCRTRNYRRWLKTSTRSSMHAVHGECNNCILHAIQPRLVRQEMLLRTPDPLSTFWGRGLGTRLYC